MIPSHDVAPQSDAGLFTVLEGARRTLQRRALDLIVLFRGSDEDPLGNLQRIVQRRIADSIIVSQTTANDPRLAWMKAEGVEFVAFGRSAGLEGYPFVDFDVESAAAETARIFVRDGHRRLAVTVGAAAGELRGADPAGDARRGLAARHRRRRGDGAADRRRAG